MPHFSRSTLALFLTVALLTAVHGWLRLAERAGYSPTPAISQVMLRDSLERQAAVQGRVAVTFERRRQARELAEEVAAGHLDLREGAARLRELYRGAPDFPWVAVERLFPDASDEERCCRLLIGEVKALEGRDGERARAAALRLEADLEGELRQGSLTLPG
jgi:hypothetical protein